MAQYDVTYACGHTGTVQLYGPMRDRRWKLDREREKLCRACYVAGRRKAEKQEAKAMGLPRLAGTEKQVAWARSLRSKRLAEMAKFRERTESLAQRSLDDGSTTPDEVAQGMKMLDGLDARLQLAADARWWIDKRHYTLKGLLQEMHTSGE